MQRNWIGRSEGARVRFALAARSDARPGRATRAATRIEVFTTRIDTIYGANFLLLAPEHPLVQQWSDEPAQAEAFARHARRSSRRRTARRG